MKRFITTIVCLLLLAGNVWAIASIIVNRGKGVLQRGSGAVATPYWTNDIGKQQWFEYETTNTTSTLGSTNGYDALFKPNAATGPTWTICGTNQNGRVEHCYAFDGVDDWLLSGYANANDAQALWAWVWIDTNDFSGLALSITGDQNYNKQQLSIQNGLARGVVSAGGNKNIYSSNEIPRGVWVHIVFQVNYGESQDMILYTNGVQATTASQMPQQLASPITLCNMGGVLNDASALVLPFKGKIDDAWVGSWMSPATAEATITNYMRWSHPTNNMMAR